MKELLSQLTWQFTILRRNNLILVSIIVTVMYGVILYFIKDLPNVEPFLTLLIYNDPAIIGMFFVGLSIIMEKNDKVISALFVTPMKSHIYLISRVLALSILGWACAATMTLVLLGPNIGWLAFSVGVFSTCVIFSFAGVFVVSFATEFLHFMLRSIPVMLALSLPLLNYFKLTDLYAFRFSPIQGPLDLILHSFSPRFQFTSLLFSYCSSIFWIVILYFLVYKVFVRRIVKAN